MIEFICRTLLILALSSVVILSVINLISSLWHRDKKPGIYNKLLNIRDLIARASGFSMLLGIVVGNIILFIIGFIILICITLRTILSEVISQEKLQKFDVTVDIVIISAFLDLILKLFKQY
jgi:hypothetical protein